MSYDITFGADVGGEYPAPLIDGDRNYTSNVSGMWQEAIGVNLGDLLASEPFAESILPQIEKGIAAMEAEPDRFKAMNPRNGWGDYEGALDVLRWIADRCRWWPKSRVHVSR